VYGSKAHRLIGRLCLSLASGSAVGDAGLEVTVSRDTEVLLHTSGPEESDKSDNTDEGCGKLEGIDDTRTVPLGDAHGDEVEEGRKDEPGGAANAEDEVEETLVELSLLAPCSVQAPGEVAPDTDPANKDVDDDEGKKGTLGIDELGGSSSLASGRDDDEEDQVADEVDDGDDHDRELARKIVVGDSPAAGDGDEENGKDDVGSTHEKLAKDTAAVGTNTVGVVDTPVDHNEEEGKDDEKNDTSEDEHDRVSNALAPQEEDSDAVDSTNEEEHDKVEDVESKETLLIETDLRLVLIDKVDGVGDIELGVFGGVARGAVQKDDVPDVRTDVIVGPEIDVPVLLNGESEVSLSHLHAGTALILVVRTPGALSIDEKSPVVEARVVLLSSLVHSDVALGSLIVLDL